MLALHPSLQELLKTGRALVQPRDHDDGQADGADNEVREVAGLCVQAGLLPLVKYGITYMLYRYSKIILYSI